MGKQKKDDLTGQRNKQSFVTGRHKKDHGPINDPINLICVVLINLYSYATAAGEDQRWKEKKLVHKAPKTHKECRGRLILLKKAPTVHQNKPWIINESTPS